MHKMFLSALMVFSMNVFAADAILLSSCEALQEISDLTARYKLVGGQIDCSGIDFQPIGNTDQPFTGELNGNGVPLVGLTIHQPNSIYVGLFGVLGENAVIKNMVIENAVVQGHQYVGILAGASVADKLSTLSNNTVSGSVSGMGYVGGLVGAASNMNIDNSHVQGVLSCSQSGEGVGGLVGGMFSTANTTRIADSSSQVSIHASECNSVGGLVGMAFTKYADDSVTVIQDSYSNSDIKGLYSVGGLVGRAGVPQEPIAIAHSYSQGTTQGKSHVGGLIGTANVMLTESYAETHVKAYSIAGGLLGYSEKSNILSSYATGSVTGEYEPGDQGAYMLGGLVGSLQDSSIMNAYATGSVSGSRALGGLVGRIYRASLDSKTVVVNAYATGRVTSMWHNIDTGGIVGMVDSTDKVAVEHSFWDLQTTGQVNSYGGGLGVNTSVLQDQAIYDANGWDFVSVWAPITSPQYPQFQYQ